MMLNRPPSPFDDAGAQTAWRLARALAAATALVGTSLPSHAARPFATEDAGVLQPRECEVEASHARVRDQANTRQRGWWLQAACGVAPGTQMGLGTGGERDGADRSRRLALVGKTQVYGLASEGLQLGVAYSVGATRVPHSAWHKDGSLATVVASWPLHEAHTLHVNVGGARFDQRSSTWLAAAWEHQLTDTWTVGLETYGTGRRSAWTAGAARWAVTPTFSLDTSYAVQRNAERSKQLSVGMKLGW